MSQSAPRAPRRPIRWLSAILGPIVVLLLLPAAGYAAEESNPNNYQCTGHIAPGKAEEGSSEQQVQYTLSCSGPISGYAIQTGKVQSTGFESSPLITNDKGEAVTTDSFSCNGEIPGFGFNCVGNTTQAFETITGQFAIASKLCAEPRVAPTLTVAYAYLNEKKVITQAISGPFELGRPRDCPAAAKASKKGKHAGKGKDKGKSGKKGKKK
jgi:hypothetical protein